MRSTTSLLATFAVSLLLAACGADGAEPGDGGGGGDPVDEGGGGGDEVGSYRVSGTVVDFATGIAIGGQATLSTLGLQPPPAVSTRGADFTVDGVPPNSIFHVLAGSSGGYTNTFGEAIELTTADVEGAIVHVVSTEDLVAAAEAFDVTPSATSAILFARAVDAGGLALAGVPADAFQLNNAAPLAGPFFLDAELKPDPALTETSASGYVVFFELAPGLVALTATPDSGLTMTMASSPAAAGAITLSVVEVVEGEGDAPPQNVSFKDDIVPMFELRGCDACHSKGEIGRDLGGLDLSGKKAYEEVTEEVSAVYGVPRINLASPADSLMLTLPSLEDPADSHPNVTFISPADPDYEKLLVWIAEGALDN